jgi:hypothetical protein
LEFLLSRYGTNQWSVVADADEILVYPGWEHLSLVQLCTYLSSERATALSCILVDMYSDRPFSETDYSPGSDPLSICPYFESDSILCIGSLTDARTGRWVHAGGMRRRLFGLPVRLDKVSLVKYNVTMTLLAGMHGIDSAIYSSLRGAVLHFKYFSDFPEKVIAEASRGEHWDGASEYARYAAAFAGRRSLKAYTERSRRFSTSEDLIDCHVMKHNDHFLNYLGSVVA